MFRAAVLTLSDKGHAGLREDESGKTAMRLLQEYGFDITHYAVLPDEQAEIENELIRLCDTGMADLLLTTGGTGFSPRDVTPEATLSVVDRLCPGIPEALRAYSLTITKRAMLSRAVAGIRKKTLIINLPGSPKAVVESLEYILEQLDHGVGILVGRDSECAERP